MDSLHLAIAFIPLAVYLLLLGLINISPRPFLTTGGRDGFALALGLSGLVIAGPMELFLPEQAAATFGPIVWILLVSLYLLSCTLLVLLGKPRIVVYNFTASELAPLLDQVVHNIDAAAIRGDDTYTLPQAALQFSIESFPALRNVSLVAVGSRQNWQSWRRLEDDLSVALEKTRTVTNPYGLSLLIMALALGSVTTYFLVQDHQAVAAALWEMLRI